jgi:hypothetical protein
MKKVATNRPANHGRQGSTGGNREYVAIAGELINRRPVLLRIIVLNRQESSSNPLLHIHAKRYMVRGVELCMKLSIKIDNGRSINH